MRNVWLAAAAMSVLVFAGAFAANAAPITVTSSPITTFKGQPVGGRVDKLIWRGGLVLRSDSDLFGGLSGIAFTGPDHQLATVSDVGNFISGRLIYDPEGHPLDFVGVTVTAIQNSRGEDLPRAFARDAEAIETIYRNGVPAAVRVGFENLTRVADFSLDNGVPGGAAREVVIPQWLSRLRTNQSLESVCIAPPASPVAGSTLLLTEASFASNGEHAGFMLGNKDRGPFTFAKTPDLNPTDCAFLPNGDLLVLERGTGFLSFFMQIVRIKAEDVTPGGNYDGEILLSASGGDIDNMEGMAVHHGPQGEIRITLVSDDNFNDWERTLLLEFALPEDKP